MPNINAQALYDACAAGDAAAVSRLLPAGGTPRNLNGLAFQHPTLKSTPLIAAAEGGHTEIVRLILERAPNTAVDHVIAIGDTAATMAGGTLRNLSGPSFQHPATKSTPLLEAAITGHTDIVRLILERATNTTVDDTGAMGFSALCMAAQYHHADTLRLLADRGANVNLTDKWRFTPLHRAVLPIHPDDRQRAPDPDGARQLATVRALLRLGAGT